MAINYAAEKFGIAIHGVVTAYEPETLPFFPLLYMEAPTAFRLLISKK